MSSTNTSPDQPYVATRKYQSEDGGGEYVISVLLHGLTKDDVTVRHSESKVGIQTNGGINGPSYREQFDVPSGAELEETDATFSNGVLTLTIPVTEGPGADLL